MISFAKCPETILSPFMKKLHWFTPVSATLEKPACKLNALKIRYCSAYSRGAYVSFTQHGFNKSKSIYLQNYLQILFSDHLDKGKSM